jgi:hypothetical protein
MYNRLESYNLQQKEYQQELNIIHNILHNNSFPIKPHKPPTTNPENPTTTHTTQKWANFTHSSRETTYITNIFKKTDLKITFCTKQTIASLLTYKDRTPDKYTLSGVYKLTCPDCHKTYVGQTGRAILNPLQRTQDSMAQPQHYIQFCTTPYGGCSLIWPP